MGEVYVYDARATDTSDIGLCGALVPLSCKFEEVANGISQITITHSHDPWDKWRSIQNGNLIKAPVPVPITPGIDMQNPAAPKRVTTVQNWRVKNGADISDRRLYKKATGSKYAKLLPFGAIVSVTAIGAARHQVKTAFGSGYVNIAGVEYAETIAIADTNGGIEAAQPSPIIMDQLFRISEVELNMDKVTAKARHVFYDMMGNLTSFSAAECSTGEAVAGVLGGCEVPVEMDGYTDTGDKRNVINYTNVEPIAALLDPEVGIAARWNLKLVRDNYEFYLLRDAGGNRGAVVEFGSNMTGITLKYDDTGVITRVIPVGKDKKGKDVYLTPTKHVDSPRIGEYPRIRAQRVDYSSSCTEKSGFSLAQVREEMARLAALEFSEKRIDQPAFSARVKFINIGDTDEYAHFRGMDRMYLYDTIGVRHRKIGIRLDAQVMRIVFDVLTERFEEMDINNARAGAAARPIPAWKLPDNIDAAKIMDESLVASKFAPESITEYAIQEGAVRNMHILDAEIDAAKIKDLAASIAVIAKAIIGEAVITTAQIENLSAVIAQIAIAKIGEAMITTAQIENLGAFVANIVQANIGSATIETAQIQDLEAYIANITQAEIDSAAIKYANVDFSNIGEAAITKLFAGSGLIRNIIVGDGTITGELVGVTIKGDLIEGNTIVADKLVVKGEDGLYYKLNTDGVSVEAQQTEYNSLHGSVITAKSITATKISVDDLVAFDATIGGFKITANSLYSGIKSSVNNTTRGVYLDSSGQIAFGDASNFLKYYRDTDGFYKLAISAEQITFGASSRNVETVIAEIQENLQKEVERLEDEITTLLRIESSQGNVFKNDMIATVLQVVVYRGSALIRDMDALRALMGADVRLQWYERRINQEEDVPLAANDIRIRDYGFSLTLNPGDIDTKSTFRCELIT